MHHALCARASCLAYERDGSRRFGELMSGWEVVVTQTQRGTGYRGIALHKKIGTEDIVIIAHRGTHTWADFRTDMDIVQGCPPRTVGDAYRFSNGARGHDRLRTLHPPPQFIETGHSLGAVLATFVSYRMNSKAVVFDPPPCRALLVNRVEADSCDANVTTYLSAPDGINNYGQYHVGDVFRLYISFSKSGNYVLRQHSIDNIVKCFSNRLGVPYLCRRVPYPQGNTEPWPCARSFMAWLFDATVPSWNGYNPYFHQSEREYNRSIEASLIDRQGRIRLGSVLGGFQCPDFTGVSDDDKRNYLRDAYDCFDYFYTDADLRAGLDVQTGVHNHLYPVRPDIFYGDADRIPIFRRIFRLYSMIEKFFTPPSVLFSVFVTACFSVRKLYPAAVREAAFEAARKVVQRRLEMLLVAKKIIDLVEQSGGSDPLFNVVGYVADLGSFNSTVSSVDLEVVWHAVSEKITQLSKIRPYCPPAVVEEMSSELLAAQVTLDPFMLQSAWAAWIGSFSNRSLEGSVLTYWVKTLFCFFIFNMAFLGLMHVLKYFFNRAMRSDVDERLRGGGQPPGGDQPPAPDDGNDPDDLPGNDNRNESARGKVVQLPVSPSPVPASSHPQAAASLQVGLFTSSDSSSARRRKREAAGLAEGPPQSRPRNVA